MKTTTPIPQLTKDLTDLADVRYDEFVVHHDEIDLLELQKLPPSRRAFRIATAEVAQERLGQTTSFWAKIDDASVGAAELSRADLEGAVKDSTTSSSSYWYITDVVTVREHRRKGIASTLLAALERHAVMESTKDTATLYLHVESENEAAKAFYESQGFTAPTNEQLEGFNAEKLSINAGAQGQVSKEWHQHR